MGYDSFNKQNNLGESNQYNSKESQNSTTLLNDIRGSFGNELMQNVKISTNDISVK